MVNTGLPGRIQDSFTVAYWLTRAREPKRLVAMPQDNQSLSSVNSRGLVRDPVYQQLNDLLQELIRSREFKAGQQFLTEREVAERFGVSRVTANKALSHLVVAGVLEFRKGVGTFLREGVLDYDLQSLMSFTRKATLAGKQPETKVLRFERLKVREIPAAAFSALRLGESDSVYYFERLRLADGEPVILERRYLVGRFCPGLTKPQGSYPTKKHHTDKYVNHRSFHVLFLLYLFFKELQSIHCS